MGKLVSVVLCGGSGRRLYPLSTPKRPKILLRIGGKSLLQQTIARLPKGPVIIALNQDLVAKVSKHIPSNAFWMVEPLKRNTAPALVTVAQHVAQTYGMDAVVFATPADHLVRGKKPFADAISQAIAKAKQGFIVTLGVVPTHSSCEFGYIKNGKQVEFTEKPNKTNAAKMVKSGEYLWNCGIYCFTPRTLLAEAQALCPSIVKHAKAALKKSTKIKNGINLDEDAFGNMPDISIDYAISQKTKRLACIPTKIEWIDIGNWRALLKAIGCQFYFTILAKCGRVSR